MKRVPILLLFILTNVVSFAQTVENIRVEPDGDNIKVNYRIGGSTDAQLYNVVLTCSMDGGPRFEPKAVIGDVGQNIRGGKSFYTIVWDVFEDRDQVGNAEFFVRVELVSDLSPTVIQPQQKPEVKEQPVATPVPQGFGTGEPEKETFERRSFIAYNGSTASPYGISFGTLKNFGFYMSLRIGGVVDDYTTDVWFTPVIGLTKYIISAGKYRLHGYAGIGTTIEAYQEIVYNTSWTDSFFTIDVGVVNVIGPIDLTLGLEYLTGIGAALVFGVGFVL